MAEQDLFSAKYLKRHDVAPLAEGAAAAEEPRPAPASASAVWLHASRWISVAVGVAFVACAIGLAVPYFTQPRSAKSTSPVDWLIRTVSGRPDQSFEKMFRDRIEANQREIQDKFRSPPTYQIDPANPIDWHVGQTTNFK